MSGIDLLRARLSTVLLMASQGVLTWREPKVYRLWRRATVAGMVGLAWVVWGAPGSDDE